MGYVLCQLDTYYYRGYKSYPLSTPWYKRDPGEWSKDYADAKVFPTMEEVLDQLQSVACRAEDKDDLVTSPSIRRVNADGSRGETVV